MKYGLLKSVPMIALLCGLAAADDQVRLRTNEPRTGVTAEELAGPTLTLLWDWNPGGAVNSSPVLAGGRCYFATSAGQVYAYDLATGAQAWQVSTGAAVLSSPCLDGGVLYVASGDGFLYALRATDGATVWSVSHGPGTVSSPVVSGGTVYVGGGSIDQNQIRAYRASDGGLLWSFNTQQPCWSSPAVSGGLVYCGSNGGILYCVDAATGTQVWTYNTTASHMGAVPSVSGGQVIFPAGSTTTNVLVLDAATGALVRTIAPVDNGTSQAWADPGPLGATDSWFYMSGAAVNGNTAYLTQELMGATGFGGTAMLQMRLFALDITNGATLWRNRWNVNGVGSSFASCPSVSARPSAPVYVYAALGNRLVCLDAATGTLTGGTGSVALVGNAFSSPACANGLVAVGTDAGRMYVFQTPNSAPSVPGSFAAETSGGANYQVDQNPRLDWADSTDAQEGAGTLTYRVEVGYNDSNLDDGATLSATTPAGESFLDLAGVPFRTHVYYRVRSRDTMGAESVWSAVQDFWLDQWNGPPPAVTDLAADWGNFLVDLSWTASTDGDVVGYRLRYQATGSGWVAPTVVEMGNVTAFTVTPLANGTSYDFRVSPLDIDGNEGAFAEATQTPGLPATVGGVRYPTIQQAADNALPGQTIMLETGQYDGAVVLPGGVSIQGQGPHLTVIHGQGALETILINGNASQPTTSITQLRVTGGVVGIEVGGTPSDDPSVALSHLVISRNGGDGVHSTSLANLTGDFLTLANNGGDGVDLSVGSAVVNDSVFSRNAGVGARNRGSAASMTLDHPCLALNAGGTVAGGQTVTGWHQALPVYMDEANDDYRSRYDCPTIDRGRASAPFANEPSANGGRANQGAFGDTEWATTISGYDLTEEIALGGGRGSWGYMQVRSHRAASFRHIGWARMPWDAYNQSDGSVHAALGNLDGQAGCEVVMGANRQGYLAVFHRVGNTTRLLRWVRVPWAAYDSAVGVTWPACGDVDGDGRDEIVVGLGAYPTNGGWAVILDDLDASFATLRWVRLSRAAYNRASGETRVACGDVDGDGRAEVILATGRAPGLGGFAEVFDDAAGNFTRLASINHPDSMYVVNSGELWPATGDLSGDGRSEVLLGPGRGGEGLVRLYRDSAGGFAPLGSLVFPWAAYNSAQGEVRVACGNLDADAADEVLGAQGSWTTQGGRAHVWDASPSYASLGWIGYDYPAYNAINGELFPAIGNMR